MAGSVGRGGWRLEEKPILVFWETTKACLLACKHCRAEAITKPLPGELSTREAMDLVDQVVEFGEPPPLLVLTGGDPLMRSDLWEIMDYAVSRGVRLLVAPSATPLLDEEAVAEISRRAVGVSISIDHPDPGVHDGIRGVEGTWERSVWAVREFQRRGVRVQVNTVVMRSTVEGLPGMVALLDRLGVWEWEVFYLVPTGRAGREESLEPGEWEDVAHFLYEASKYGLVVRTVEGPLFRRVSVARLYLERRGRDPDKVLRPGGLYRRLRARLEELMGPPRGLPRVHTVGTRDGLGVVFVAYNGVVYPSGFLPIPVGSVRTKRLPEIYRGAELLKKLRSASFRGRCGRCEFRSICGGSRARAYAYTGDPLAEDPACPYAPGSYGELGVDVEEALREARKLSRPLHAPSQAPRGG